MDDRFYNAFLPPTIRIAGRSLKRFTIWHQFLLSAVGSPIYTGAEKFTVKDLLVAAKCCRSKYGKSITLKATLYDIWWGFLYHKLPWLFELHASRLWEWIGIQCSQPKYWRKSHGGGHYSGIDRSPKCLGMACSLMARAGFTREDAWNTPLGEAQWIDAQIAKLEGVGIQFLNDDDLKDEAVDISNLTEEEAFELFNRELPNEKLALASFEHWKNERNKHHA